MNHKEEPTTRYQVYPAYHVSHEKMIHHRLKHEKLTNHAVIK